MTETETQASASAVVTVTLKSADDRRKERKSSRRCSSSYYRNCDVPPTIDEEDVEVSTVSVVTCVAVDRRSASFVQLAESQPKIPFRGRQRSPPRGTAAAARRTQTERPS